MPVNDTRKAVGMFKDEYLLDYINIEEMEVDKPEDIDERVIEKAIVRNIKKFIMTFGRDRRSICCSELSYGQTDKL